MLRLLLVALSACQTPPDEDGDGIAAAAGDCNDKDAAIYPGQFDPVGDTVDQDCDGVDGSDADGDGVISTASGGEDCDDEAADIPGEETPDGRDEDCSGCADDFGYVYSTGWTDTDDGLLVIFGLSYIDDDVQLGLAETGAGAGGWYGEDCTSSEQCHLVPKVEGVRFEVVARPEDVVLGETSLFDPDRMSRATAILFRPGWSCLVLGDDPSYYAEFGCCPSPMEMWWSTGPWPPEE